MSTEIKYDRTNEVKLTEAVQNQIEDLPNVLLSEGIRNWLCREEGVIAQTISRFKEKSSIEERVQQIEFTREELPKLNCFCSSFFIC